jgi:glycosyltransferase involved in cell wall biosynthesis
MLPLGVVIPTRNSRPYLAAHVAGLKEWIDLAQEIVVVDSFSTDGTVDYLKENLSHPRITFASHPPGLYASWNHGIAQVRAPYLYIATAGDLVTRAGIQQLVETAQKLDCDVVVSKPTFRDLADAPLPDYEWPIDDVIASLKITSPRKLTKLEALILCAVHARMGLLGSSASDVFRTSMIQRLPYPTDHGNSGDGVWALKHVAEVSWGVFPEKVTSFLIHPPNPSSSPSAANRPEYPRSDAVLRASMDSWRSSGMVSANECTRIKWNELMKLLTSYLDGKAAFDRDRRRGIPWFLNPVAWRNRSLRENSSKRLNALKHQLLAECRESAVTG